MLNRVLNICTVLILFTMAACSGGRGESRERSAAPDAAMPTQIGIPDVPDSISDPAGRADYLLLHFWDSVNFADSRAMADSVMIEQGMSDYISVMEFCSQQGLERGIGRLLDRASSASPEAYGRIAELAERYLYDPQSPFRSERYYTPFVEYAISRGGDEGVRAQARLEDIRRNAPGSMAPDFSVTGPDGRTFTLSSQLKEGAPVALMFYEPDCDQCREAIASLTANPDFARLTESGLLRFMAVYIGDYVEEWRRHAEGLPRSWKIGIDSRRVIDDRDLYLVEATPSFYLIAPDGRILLKDSDLSRFYQAIFRP